jgi:hypothetical protein
MFPRVDPAQSGFPDLEGEVFGEKLCGHAVQNSHRRLLQALGPWAGGEKPVDDGAGHDTTAPTVAFVEPGPGAVVTQPFVIRAQAMDDVAVDRVVLTAGADEVTARRPPFEWSLSGFPPGPLRLALTAYDADGNASTATLDVQVAAAPPPGGCAVAGASGSRRDASGTGGGAAVLVTFTLALAVAACGRRRPRL